MDDLTWWNDVKVKKDFEASTKEGDKTNKNKFASEHERYLIEVVLTDKDKDTVDEGEFRRLLDGEEKGDDDESVNGSTNERPVIDCEGMFDNENPAVYDADGDELMCLDTETNPASVLKRLGNSAHKEFNKNALVDGFEKGKCLLKNVIADRSKILKKAERTENHIRMAVEYFVQERDRRRLILENQTAKEESGDLLLYEMEDWEKNHIDYRDTIDQSKFM